MNDKRPNQAAEDAAYAVRAAFIDDLRALLRKYDARVGHYHERNGADEVCGDVLFVDNIQPGNSEGRYWCLDLIDFATGRT